VIAECRKLDNDIAIATITPEKLTAAGGYRYKKARRPELYHHIIGQSHKAEQKVAWLYPETTDASKLFQNLIREAKHGLLFLISLLLECCASSTIRAVDSLGSY
jgi:hypothetical protein